MAKLPPAVHAGYVHAFAASLHTVFLIATPIAAVAFALTWLLKEIPLRAAASAPDPAQVLVPNSVPEARNGADDVVRALSVLARKEDRVRVYERLAEAASVNLDPRSTWILFRLDGHPGSTCRPSRPPWPSPPGSSARSWPRSSAPDS